MHMLDICAYLYMSMPVHTMRYCYLSVSLDIWFRMVSHCYAK